MSELLNSALDIQDVDGDQRIQPSEIETQTSLTNQIPSSPIEIENSSENVPKKPVHDQEEGSGDINKRIQSSENESRSNLTNQIPSSPIEIPKNSSDDVPKKRVHDQGEGFDDINKRIKLDDTLVPVVAAHYNTIIEKGLTERNKSRIVFMRNFNNWIKSQLIHDYLQKSKRNAKEHNNLNVLDMCCGKGGDLLKWRNANIKHLICVDLAEVSVRQSKERYEEMKERNRSSRERNENSRFPPIFSAEFHDADCTKIRIKDLFHDKDQLFDLVSCQFSFHYCFESLPQAECMMRNAAESLRPGGYFIGTIPNANDIVKRQRLTGESSFGNEVYKIEFDCDVNKQFAFFGARYNFFLEGVVNCPEFLVYFPMLVKLAEKYGLKFVEKDTFKNYFERTKEPGRQLLGRMQALETYPPWDNEKLLGSDDDYIHAKDFLNNHRFCQRVGTLSRSEWEAITLYMVFAFIKESS